MSRTDADDTSPMERNLSYRLSILNSLLSRQTAAIYQSRTLTMHQWKVMSVLYSWPPMPAVRITEMVTIDKAAISRAVSGLLERALATRELDPASGTINVVLTQEGRALYADMMTEMKHLQSRVFSDCTASDQSRLFEIFDKIEDTLRAMAEPEKNAASH